MRFGIINVVLSVLALCAFWIYHGTNKWDEKTVTHHTYGFVYHAQETNGEFRLHSNDLTKWIAEMNDERLKNSSVRLSLLTIFAALCNLTKYDSYNPAFEFCCGHIQKYLNKLDLIWCLQSMGHIGTVPIVREVWNGTRSLPLYPPKYNNSMVYREDVQLSDGVTDCHVDLPRRENMYQLFLKWIQMAEKHKIVWWLTYGSLLGSVRHKDFIPYDHDTDVAVLGSYETIVRELSVTWKDATYEQPFLIARHCRIDHGMSLNCRGIPGHFHGDPCVFCAPVARIISGPYMYFDVFLVHAKVVVDENNANETRVGLLDESVESEWKKRLSYSLNDVFPLSICTYMGLNVPCPRNPDSILAHVYGKDYMKPQKLCDQRSGIWHSV